MGKRFTDTNKYKKPFIRSLQGPYKLLWDYLYHDCDHAGIWIVDFEVAQIYIGADMPVNKYDALKSFNNGETRIVEFDGGKKWFLPSFINFQYGELNPQNRAHHSVIQILKSNNLLKDAMGYISPLQGAKDKDKDMDIVLDKDKDINNGEIFDFDILKRNDQIIESIFRMTVTSKNIPVEYNTFTRLLDEFCNKQRILNAVPKNKIDYKDHFINWVNKQIIKPENQKQRKMMP